VRKRPERPEELGRVARRRPALDRLRPPVDRDQVHRLPACDRVMHDVAAAPEPKPGLVSGKLARNVGPGDRGAPGDRAAVGGPAPVADRSAHLGPEPVCPDHGIRMERLAAARPLNRQRRRGFPFGQGRDGAPDEQANVRPAAHRVEQDAVQVGAGDDPVGRAEALAHGGAERDGADRLSRRRAPDRYAGRLGRDAAQGRSEAEVEEHAACVRRELKAGSGLVQRRAALQHHGRAAAPGQRQRGR
jgi:hypothetical protein